MRRILMITFHYPPCQGGSGVERALAFSRYLSEYGWQPIVLSVTPRTYKMVDLLRVKDIPKDIIVKRTFALDATRDLALSGKYMEWTALPDQWVSWWLSAVPEGLRLIRAYKPALIWSTYTITTANLIALTLHKMTGLPWIADIRDPITTDVRNPNERSSMRFRASRWIEAKTVRHCSKAIFTTMGTERMYINRYPDVPFSRWAVIANGYNEDDFMGIGTISSNKNPQSRQITLLHSGSIYHTDRSPSTFFSVLENLINTGVISPMDISIVLRATGNDAYCIEMINKYHLSEVVTVKPTVTHREAIMEMMNADGLLVFQGPSFNNMIPAKVFEYIRAQLPILALTDPQGDTAGLLKSVGVGAIAPLESREDIKRIFPEFLKDIREGTALVASGEEVSNLSRRTATGCLARLLDEVAGEKSGYE